MKAGASINYFGAIPVTGAVETFATETVILDPSETVKNAGIANFPVGIKYRFPATRGQYGVGGGLQTFTISKSRQAMPLTLITLMDIEGRPIVQQAPVLLWPLNGWGFTPSRKTVIFAKGTLVDFKASYFEFTGPVAAGETLEMQIRYW